MPFLPPNQQCQSTEGTHGWTKETKAIILQRFDTFIPIRTEDFPESIIIRILFHGSVKRNAVPFHNYMVREQTVVAAIILYIW